MRLMIRRLFVTVIILCSLFPHSLRASMIKEHVLSLGQDVEQSVWVNHNPNTDVVAVGLLFPQRGAVQDPQDKRGLANFATRMLEEGSGRYNSLELQTILKQNGIELSAHASYDNIHVILRFLRGSQKQAFSILETFLLQPRLKQDSIEKVRQQILAEYQHGRMNPDRRAFLRLKKLVYQEHPYAYPVIGLPAHIRTITRDDVRSFLRTYINRTNIYVSVSGNIDQHSVNTLLTDLLKKMPSAEKSIHKKHPSLSTKSDKSMDVIDIDIPQTSVFCSLPAINRHHPDFIPLYMMTNILGGNVSSRLFLTIREKMGLVYSVDSHMSQRQHDSRIVFHLASSNNSVIQALRVMREQIQKTVMEPISKKELKNIKAYLIGDYLWQLQSSTDIARWMLWLQENHLPLNYLRLRTDMIGRVTEAELHRVAKTYMDTQKLVCVLAGQPQFLSERL